MSIHDQSKVPLGAFSLDDLIRLNPDTELKAEFVTRMIELAIEELQKKGLTYYEDPNEVYRQRWGKMVIRRESPQRLLQSLLKGQDLELAFRGLFGGGGKYNNAALYEGSHVDLNTVITTAILEGFSKSGGIYTIAAFDAEAPDIHIDTAGSGQTHRQILGETIDLTKNRAVSGTIHSQDMRFVLLGTIAQRFPKSKMTEQERERLVDFEEEVEAFKQHKKTDRPEPFYVTRAFTFEKLLSSQQSV